MAPSGTLISVCWLDELDQAAEDTPGTRRRECITTLMRPGSPERARKDRYIGNATRRGGQSCGGEEGTLRGREDALGGLVPRPMNQEPATVRRQWDGCRDITCHIGSMGSLFLNYCATLLAADRKRFILYYPGSRRGQRGRHGASPLRFPFLSESPRLQLLARLFPHNRRQG